MFQCLVVATCMQSIVSALEVHDTSEDIYIPTTFNGCEQFRSTVVPLVSSTLHVYTPSSSEFTLSNRWVKVVPEHSVWEATTTPLWSHFREETEVKLKNEKTELN